MLKFLIKLSLTKTFKQFNIGCMEKGQKKGFKRKLRFIV